MVNKMNDFFDVTELHEMRMALLAEETNKHLKSIFQELRQMLGEFNCDKQYLIYGCDSWTSSTNLILLRVRVELENYGYFVEMKKSSNNTDYYLLISW